MPHSESRKTSGCDAVVFRKRPLDAVCLTVWNGTHATLEKQEADSGEVSSQHSVGFFKDGCTNLLWRRAAGWLDWMGRDEPERQRAESQWIVAARPLCHLQYPVAYLSRLQRILPAARWKLYFKAAAATRYEGKTNLSHDGLNPAHVPYWWVNNPTLGEFCFTMIGRADIEGSKSNVAMNAWLPQASYPCGNFSDTSSFEFRRSKGSLGHAFTYRCGPPPEFPLASPRSGIVHHLSGPDRYAHSRTLLKRSRSVGGATLGGIPPISFVAPYGYTRPLTRTHVRLLGSCLKMGRMGSPQASVRSARCRSIPPARTPQLLNTFAGSFYCAGFDNDPFAGSPTETLLRLVLPLNDKVQWTSREVAGSEPPTLPRSEHFTGSFNR
ncbi:hypothetical protein CQW23_32599 [Capsicum baccatum]|uniref:Protein TAR1 n=1 Tax=Capsicum baccatum TaxID=33114 RepID=A0A2G2V4D3_CAPBA|nr:hypothetical protein CQW23_32599 [Capsicum baccatum]